MIELLPPPAPHVVAYRIGGVIEKEAIARVFDAIEDALAEHDTVNLYAEIVDLKGASLQALLKDVIAGLKLLPRLNRFDRYAIVTNAAWLQKAANIEDRLIPGLDIRTFALDEADAAQEWVVGGEA